MSQDIIKSFTAWMNEAFCGAFNEACPEDSVQMCHKLELSDGTQLSIQASGGHYCSPRENSPIADYDFYDKFEIGFPTKEIPELLEYAEDPEDPTGTVYAMVPKELIQDIVNQRGGVVKIVGSN